MIADPQLRNALIPIWTPWWIQAKSLSTKMVHELPNLNSSEKLSPPDKIFDTDLNSDSETEEEVEEMEVLPNLISNLVSIESLTKVPPKLDLCYNLVDIM